MRMMNAEPTDHDQVRAHFGCKRSDLVRRFARADVKMRSIASSWVSTSCRPIDHRQKMDVRCAMARGPIECMLDTISGFSATTMQ